MSEIILVCGKICAGKTAYANELIEQRGGILLSADEAMLSLHGCVAEENHDLLLFRTKRYLLNLAVSLCKAGNNVVLDWGFWTEAERRLTRDSLAARGTEVRLHYLEISPEEQQLRVEKRNACESDSNYPVDKALLEKCNNRFEVPEDMDEKKYC